SPFSLTPGQTGQVQVAFSPVSAGSFSNVVVFTSNGGNSANTVTGSGLTPAQLGVSPGSLDFGTIAVGSSAQASFVITNQGGAAPPAASFSGSPTSGLKPLTVSFTDNSSGTITNRFWDFGDSSTTNTTATTFNHTYLAAGTNTVSLTVSGPLGTDTFSLANYI